MSIAQSTAMDKKRKRGASSSGHKHGKKQKLELSPSHKMSTSKQKSSHSKTTESHGHHKMKNEKIDKLTNTDNKPRRSIHDSQSGKKSKKFNGKNCDSKSTVKSSQNTAAPVKKPTEVSANWKALQKMLPKKNTNFKKTLKPSPKPSKDVSKSVKKNEDEVWFDDVDDIYLEKSVAKDSATLVKTDSFKGLTKTVAMDCEMVGVGADGADSALARVSLVNQYGHCIYDTFVKVKEPVTDYRTQFSGVRPADLENGEAFEIVQKKVNDIIRGRVLVGHAIYNDLQVLYLDHPRKMTRDTSRYKPFRVLFGGRNPSLKKLTEKLLGVDVQKGEHNSVEDAQATMRLYTMHKQKWEKSIAKKYKTTKSEKTKSDSTEKKKFSKLDD